MRLSAEERRCNALRPGLLLISRKHQLTPRLLALEGLQSGGGNGNGMECAAAAVASAAAAPAAGVGTELPTAEQQQQQQQQQGGSSTGSPGAEGSGVCTPPAQPGSAGTLPSSPSSSSGASAAGADAGNGRASTSAVVAAARADTLLTLLAAPGAVPPPLVAVEAAPPPPKSRWEEAAAGSEEERGQGQVEWQATTDVVVAALDIAGQARWEQGQRGCKKAVVMRRGSASLARLPPTLPLPCPCTHQDVGPFVPGLLPGAREPEPAVTQAQWNKREPVCGGCMGG